jgi:hypothetical protein
LKIDCKADIVSLLGRERAGDRMEEGIHNQKNKTHFIFSHLGAACLTMGIFLSHVIPATFLSEKASALPNAPAALDASGSFASGRVSVTLG